MGGVGYHGECPGPIEDKWESLQEPFPTSYGKAALTGRRETPGLLSASPSGFQA